jgi:hypothetical protein
MVDLSENIIDIKANSSKLQFRYWRDDDSFGVPFYHHGVCVIIVFFDPWSGVLLEGSFKDYMDCRLEIAEKLDIIREIEKKHDAGLCSSLSYYIDGGEDNGLTPLIHIPNIRTYAILNKKEYGGFEPMDYCPFCGAKFPDRLDEELTSILRSEYGLDSWKGYKRAPHEFHTDEWWKKRGL